MQTAPLQRLQAQLQAGHPLHLAAVGGSSTAGHSLARDSEDLYHRRLGSWINSSFPHADHHVVNSGTPAAGPQYMEKCLSSQLMGNENLVLIEYTQNIDLHTPQDGLALERLLRRLLLWPSSPAIVYLSLPGSAFGPPRRICRQTEQPPGRPSGSVGKDTFTSFFCHNRHLPTHLRPLESIALEQCIMANE